MKSYSNKKFEFTLTENMLTDFLKVAKKKYFDKNIFISSEIANEAKEIFSKTFISALSTDLKFKTFAFSNLIYKPSKVIVTIQNKLLEMLKTEKSRPNTSSNIFKFVSEDTDYKKNTSLLAECYSIVNLMELWIKDNLERCLSETYQLNPVNMKSKDIQSYVSGFKKVFLEIFEQKEHKFRFNMSLDDFSERNDFSYLAYKVIKALNKETKKSTMRLDIENMYVNDELYVVDDTVEVSDADADRRTALLNDLQLYPAVTAYGRKFSKFIPMSEYPQYIDVYKIAYREAIIRSKSLKNPQQSIVLDIMHEYIASVESTNSPKPVKV